MIQLWEESLCKVAVEEHGSGSSVTDLRDLDSMDAELVRKLLLNQAHATEETPFGAEHLVCKIGGE